MTGHAGIDGGIRLPDAPEAPGGPSLHDALALLGELGLREASTLAATGGGGIALRLEPSCREAWMPGFDTLNLSRVARCPTLDADRQLQREALIAMLGSPVSIEVPSVAELRSALRLRQRTAQAAERTALRFHTTGLERPVDDWTYDEDRGFRLRPGRDLIPALRRATQPAAAGPLYAFSCYRATEYVLLLALAEELADVNPRLLEALQERWTQHPIASGRFHDVFLRESGSTDCPLPDRFYIPGDRVWFRNPDDASSDASGYEGSWTFYLGGGRFANLWKRDLPFTLESKCLEIYHWRHATFVDPAGHLRVDETKVEGHVRNTLRDPHAVASVLQRMLRLRDPRGVYAQGGCLDRTRECLRWVHPATSDLSLPPLAVTA